MLTEHRMFASLASGVTGWRGYLGELTICLSLLLGLWFSRLGIPPKAVLADWLESVSKIGTPAYDISAGEAENVGFVKDVGIFQETKSNQVFGFSEYLHPISLNELAAFKISVGDSISVRRENPSSFQRTYLSILKWYRYGVYHLESNYRSREKSRTAAVILQPISEAKRSWLNVPLVLGKGCERLFFPFDTLSKSMQLKIVHDQMWPMANDKCPFTYIGALLSCFSGSLRRCEGFVELSYLRLRSIRAGLSRIRSADICPQGAREYECCNDFYESENPSQANKTIFERFFFSVVALFLSGIVCAAVTVVIFGWLAVRYGGSISLISAMVILLCGLVSGSFLFGCCFSMALWGCPWFWLWGAAACGA
jgi:hypothetical protein